MNVCYPGHGRNYHFMDWAFIKSFNHCQCNGVDHCQCKGLELLAPKIHILMYQQNGLIFQLSICCHLEVLVKLG